LKGSHRAKARATERETDLATCTFLIGLRSAKMNDQALAHGLDVCRVKPDDF
jgi:hypothetical protein